MEQAAKKLLKERDALYGEIRKLKKRIEAINTGLEIIELRVADDPKFAELEGSLPNSFHDKTLPQSCSWIFDLYDGWLDKNQVEYLLTVGGYPFDAKDPTNSVDVTLRRMVTDGECEVEKRGFLGTATGE